MTEYSKQSAVDRLKEDSLEILSVPSVADRLGRYTVALSEAVERTSFAGVDDEGFIETSEIPPDVTPIVPRYAGEGDISIHARNSGMVIGQIRALAGLIGEEKAQHTAQKTDAHFRSTGNHRTLPTFGAEDAATTAANFWIPEVGTLVSGRPHVVFNMDSAVNNRLSPVVFLHELTHVLQRIETPVEQVMEVARRKIRSELEAYYVSTQIVLGFKDTERQRELLAHTTRGMVDRTRKIESVRSKYQQSEDPFEPSNSIVKGLVDNELGITNEVGKLIRDQKASPKVNS